MTWQPMSEEQLSEFESLESASSEQVGGVYRHDRRSWFLIAIMLGVGGALNMITVLDTAPELSFKYVITVLAVVLCTGTVAGVLWVVWQDRRYGLLDDGLAFVSRNKVGLIPWERITQTDPVGVQIGTNRKLKVSLDSGETFKMMAPRHLSEQLARRIGMRDDTA